MKGMGRFMFTKEDRLKAVYASELEQYLDKMGLLEKFKQNLLICRYCGEKINSENLYAFVPSDGKIELCCNKPDCILKLTGEAEK